MIKLATRAVYFRKRAVYFRKRTPYICPRARYSCRRALYSAKEPCILAKEPFILAKEPYVLAKEPCILAKEPYVSVNKKNKEEKREALVIDNKVGLTACVRCERERVLDKNERRRMHTRLSSSTIKLA